MSINLGRLEYLLHSTVKYNILHGTGYAASGVAAVESPSSRSQGAWGVEGVAEASRGRSSWAASCGRVLRAHFAGGVGGTAVLDLLQACTVPS